MKKNKNLNIVLLLLVGALLIALIVHILFKIKVGGVFQAEWSAGDFLNYIGTMIAAISTFVLGIIAYKQNDRLQKLEDNNYVATNSCMVIIEEVKITPRVEMPVDYNLHAEQILKEEDNMEKMPSGYKVEIKIKKVDSSSQGTPSLVYVPKCSLMVGDGESNTLLDYIWVENIREGYTRTAIFENAMSFNCTLLVKRSKQEKFEKAIKKKNNKILVEMFFDIITDKYVVTKCKCRAYCDYLCTNSVVSWKSEKPMVFFYGHEMMNKEEIIVLADMNYSKEER